MFPENAVILFMHTNNVRQRHEIAVVIGHVGVKIANFAQAVAAELQGIGQPSDTVFSHVESVLAVMAGTDITIRYNHFGQCCPVENGTQAPLVLIANSVKDEALSWREPQAKLPVIPCDLVPIHSEARTIRLDNVERFEGRSQWPNGICCVIAWLRWQRHNAKVFYFQHLHCIKV